MLLQIFNKKNSNSYTIPESFIYERSNQLENLGNKDDTLLIFSSSGKSPNILEVVKLAKKKNISVISFIGFSDNTYLKKNSKLNMKIKAKKLLKPIQNIYQMRKHLSAVKHPDKTNKKPHCRGLS